MTDYFGRWFKHVTCVQSRPDFHQKSDFLIMQLRRLPALLATLLCTSPAFAAADLIGFGSLPGTLSDLSGQSAPLESGVAGNPLGGVGSGFAWAGGNTFLALPDRGPNALSYNAAIDHTTSYIPRFHDFTLTLGSSAGGVATVTPTLSSTTLLWSSTPLVYGTGTGLGVGSGAPALNSNGRYYFTGRSDNYSATQNSTSPNNGRFDPEGIRVSNDGKSVFISDEYGPYVYQFNRATGERIKTFSLPQAFSAATLNPVGDTEIASNTVGRIANKGMEGLAITPDGKTLVGIMQSPLAQDGGTKAANTRIVTIDIATGATKQFAYSLDNIGTAKKPKYTSVSEIVAINDHEFLIDERDGKGVGDDSNAVFKKLFKIDLANATEVSGLEGAALADTAVSKTLFLDVVANLNAHGYTADQIPSKMEGLAFGQDVSVNGQTLHTLYFVNDNDFLASNPNNFYVFGFNGSDLPNLQLQQIAAVPEPETYAMLLGGLGLLALVVRRRKD